MMRLHVLFLASFVASVALAQSAPDPEADPAGDADAVDNSGDSILPQTAAGTALVNALTTCMTAEGDEVTPDDQAALQQASPGLVAAVSAGQGLCAAATTSDACAAIISAQPCDGLAGALTANLPALPLPGPPPAWATQYVSALVGMIVQCYTAETGSAPSDDDQATLTSFQAQLAGVFGALGSNTLCTVDETALPACIATLNGTSCDTIGEAVDSDDPTALGDLISSCTGLLQCNGGAAQADADGTTTQ